MHPHPRPLFLFLVQFLLASQLLTAPTCCSLLPLLAAGAAATAARRYRLPGLEFQPQSYRFQIIATQCPICRSVGRFTRVSLSRQIADRFCISICMIDVRNNDVC
jgi:hypothetical protein